MSGEERQVASPSLAILSFWQGVVEIVLRLLAPVVGSLPAFIAALVALDTGKNNDDLNDLEMTNSREGDFDLVNDLVELRDNTYAGTGFVIAVTLLAIIVEVAIIALRFINCNFSKIEATIFLIIDIAISVVLAVCHLAGGFQVAAYDWKDYVDDFSINGYDISGDDISDHAHTIRQSMITCAVFCFIATLLFALLAVYMIVFLIKNWNSKMGTYKVNN